MKRILLSIAFFIVTQTTFAQSDSLTTNIRKLLAVTGTDKMMTQMMANVTTSFKTNLPDVPEAFWTEFAKGTNVNELIDLLIPIYAKYYSNKEVLDLIAFYKTTLGQKVTATLPMITQDSYEAGSAWGKKLGEKVVAKLRADGYLKSE